jgi:hypothetical protein
MDVAGLKDAAQIGLIGLALTEALEGGFLVAEGLEEGERELGGVERLLGQRRNCLFDLDCVHSSPSRYGSLNKCPVSVPRSMENSLVVARAGWPFGPSLEG